MDYLIISIYIVLCFIAIYRVDKFSIIDAMGLIILGCVLILFCTFKPIYEVADAEGYIENSFYADINERIEPLSTLLTDLSKIIFDDPAGLFFIFALVSISIRLYGITKYASFIWASIAIYLYQTFILHDFIQIRAAIASAIMLCCIGPLFHRKAILYFSLCIIAMLFHYSAIIMFLFWFIGTKKINKYIYITLIPFCYLLALSGHAIGNIAQFIPIPFVQMLFAAYEYKEGIGVTEVNLFVIPQIIRCCIFIYLLYHWTTLQKHCKYAVLLLKLYAVGLSSYILFSDIPTFANRFSELLFVFEIFIFPFIAFTIRQRRIGLAIPLAIGFILMLNNIYHLELVPS